MDERERLLSSQTQVESELRSALVAVADRLSTSETQWIREFLDRNELGLAFETLVEALQEQEVPFTAYEHLARAKADMQLPDDDAWKRLARRFAKPS